MALGNLAERIVFFVVSFFLKIGYIVGVMQLV